MLEGIGFQGKYLRMEAAFRRFFTHRLAGNLAPAQAFRRFGAVAAINFRIARMSASGGPCRRRWLCKMLTTEISSAPPASGFTAHAMITLFGALTRLLTKACALYEPDGRECRPAHPSRPP
jgi:hypothetical protein